MLIFSRLLHRINPVLASLFLLGMAVMPRAASADEEYGALQQLAPTPAPPISLLRADRETLETQEDWKGKIVILNFWATWCGPCVKEMPSLNALAKAYADKDVLVIPASQDITGYLTIKTFYRRKNLDALPVIWDKDSFSFKSFELSVLPVSIILDRQGQVIARVSGDFDWDSTDFHAYLDKALAKK